MRAISQAQRLKRSRLVVAPFNAQNVYCNVREQCKMKKFKKEFV